MKNERNEIMIPAGLCMLRDWLFAVRQLLCARHNECKLLCRAQQQDQNFVTKLACAWIQTTCGAAQVSGRSV